MTPSARPEGRLFAFDVPGILRGAAIKKHHGEEAFLDCRDHHECLIYANYCDWLKTQRLTDPAAARSRPAQPDETHSSEIADDPAGHHGYWVRSEDVAALAAARHPQEEHAMNDLEYLDAEKNPPVGGRFHWRDGYYFQRTRLGAVLMTLPDHSQKVIPPHEWASIVAQVSHAGETGETWQAALTFHGEATG